MLCIMTSIYFASTPETNKDISCSVVQTSLIENARIAAARSLCWLVILLGSMHYGVCGLEAFMSYRSLLLKWNDDTRDVENTDDDRTDEYTCPSKRCRSENTENENTPGEIWMNDDRSQHEDGDDSTDQQESTGDEEDDDEDDDNNDDGDGDSEYSGDDDEDDDNNDDGDDDSEYSDDDEDCEEEEEDSDTKSFEEDMGDNTLLAHAREVYASDSFLVFKREYRKCLALDVDVRSEDTWGLEYEVNKSGDYYRKYKVTADWFGETVKCSCNYFSVTGFLCSHSLLALRCLHVEKIPDRYLLRWQMRNFSSYQTPRQSSLKTRKDPRPSDDGIKVSRGARICSFYKTLYDDGIDMDFDYIAAPLLRHAKDVYVPESYNMFREEYKRSEFIFTFRNNEDFNGRGITVDYDIIIPRCSRKFIVHSEPANGTVSCTCKKFAVSGILCCHALHVLSIMDIVKIPPQYITPKHMKASYVVNDEKIHGPNYPEFESLIRWRVREDRIDMFTSMASKFNVAVDSDILEGCLQEIWKKPSCEATSGCPLQALKAETKFWDDQGIMSFTYKDSVITRRLYYHWWKISSRCNMRFC